ncbi:MULTISPECIES: diaminopimelate decarboxylase [Alcaligenes]|uniref:diaminopimelate decarboxylase n=1 Tax=Alcaligenes TaxID=507 RepID=UPI00075F3A90|nr:diaminopimelate decarboxylase [Alcaligenes faecalis]ASC90661.1 diaminopimelate decarboxylase [Alcaligenes faecalis]KVX04842.1 diaminopimelate decarboxylase [Alcaligenes faecalis]SSY85518.1 Diaminopimelate decarboxylase [Alcaligenes faecalis subsp. faecalis]
MTVAPHFQFQNNTLHAEQVPLNKLAEEFGTPLYVYSRQALRDAWESYRVAGQDRKLLVCYGMKANSNLAILQEFARLGTGFDIVSGGELARVIAAGGDPGKVVFSGVGKQVWEIEAALKAGVKCFNVESEGELERVAQVAERMNVKAPVSLRVNPDVDARTHPYISTGLKDNKFGVPIDQAPRIYARAQELPSLNIVGVDCHIGSQITEVSPYLDALDKLIKLILALKEQGVNLTHLDLGGGLGIRYTDETLVTPTQLLTEVFAALDKNGLGHLEIVLEPGRSMVGNAGVLLSRVEYLKHGETKNFAIIDAAMNDLIRPTLYDAWHGVEAVEPRPVTKSTPRYDLVGPICESGDWLARDRQLDLKQDDLVAIMSAGAYAFTMASQYNTRPRAAEILVDGDQVHVIRPRESLESLFATERLLP